MDASPKELKPNRRLRRERELRGWSQRRVADEIGTNVDTVSKWERGINIPDPFFREKLCILFGKDAVELGFLEDVKISETPGESQILKQVEEVSDNLSPALSLPSITFSTDSMLQLSTKIALYEGAINNPEVSLLLQRLGISMDELRRLLVFGIAGIVLSGNLLDPEPYERLRNALKKPSAIDETALNHLETVTRDSWRMIPAVAGVVSYHSRSYVLEQLNTVTKLLEASQPTAAHERLCSIAGELSLIVANISSNMRDYSSAKTYYELSIEAAKEAKNLPLQAVSLVRLSFNSTRNDRADIALSLAEEANCLVRQSGEQTSATTRSWAAAALAEVYANLKTSRACFEALEQAELLINSVGIESDPYHTTFSLSLLNGYKGVCYTLLSLPEDAEKVLRTALDLLPASPAYQKGYILSDLAGSCIQQGKLEEMHNYASNALAIAVQAKAPEVFQRVHKLRRGLDAWTSTSYIKNLDIQIHNTEQMLYSGRG